MNKILKCHITLHILYKEKNSTECNEEIKEKHMKINTI